MRSSWSSATAGGDSTQPRLFSSAPSLRSWPAAEVAGRRYENKTGWSGAESQHGQRAGIIVERSRSEAGTYLSTWDQLQQPVFCIWLFDDLLRYRADISEWLRLTLQVIIMAPTTHLFLVVTIILGVYICFKTTEA